MSAPDTSHVMWRKSSRSANAGHCVEVAMLRDQNDKDRQDAIWLVRDSKDPSGPVLRFRLNAWAAFIANVKKGSMNL